MKYLWVSSVFMAGLILDGGNAFAESENILSGRAQNLSESRLLLADASLDLDITMEVVDEDVQSSKDITNIIELPLGNEPEFSNGPGEGQGHDPNLFLERNPEYQQRRRINRPDDIGSTDGAGRTDSVSPGEMFNRDNATRGPAGSGEKCDGRTDSVSPGEMFNRDNATRGPAGSGEKCDGQSKKKGE
jgi:hypothetical protein